MKKQLVHLLLLAFWALVICVVAVLLFPAITPAAIVVLLLMWGSILLRINDTWLRYRRGRAFDYYRRGICLGCGYDMRACSDRCSECGRPIDRPQDPLPCPAKPSSSTWVMPQEVVRATWLVQLRGPTPPSVWGDEKRAAIAALVAQACKRGACWPNDHFLPHDPFAVMIDDWEGMGWFEVARTLHRRLGISLDREAYQRYLKMTFRQVVDELAALSADGSAPVRGVSLPLS